MKTIFLAGNYGGPLQNIYDDLLKYFRVYQIAPLWECIAPELEKITPDLIILFQPACETLEFQIFRELSAYHADIPVLILCSTEDFSSYRTSCPAPQFSFLFRPIRMQRLLIKCANILQDQEVLETLNTENPEGGDAKQISPVVEETVTIPAVPALHSREKLKILAIDDSPLTLRSFKKMLEKNYEIRLCFSAEKAFEMLSVFMPDIIFLDYEMPGMSGMQFFQQLKNHDKTKDIPVIFLTGVADRDRILQVLMLKPAGYLLKPLEEARLTEAIDNAKKLIQK